MLWLFAVVVLICAMLFPGFRKVLLVVAALLAGIVAVIYLRNESEEAGSKKRIALSEIELADVRLQGDYGYEVTGRVRNHSARYTLSGFALRVTLEDCMNDTTCDVVSQGNESAYGVFVPPGQARDFRISVIGTYALRLKGKLRWDYSLVETRGRE